MTTTPKEGEAGKHAALDALRAALLAGDVVPGQRLVEAELAETFGVTRASMRAALIDLTAEGLVERIPHRGARVRVVSIEEAVAITECRMVLEGLCAAKAAEKVTDDEIDSLRELAGRLRAAVDEGESMKYSELNRELHRTVREIAGQSVAAELLERLHGQIVRHQFRLAMRAGRPHVSLPEHLAIIEAIARRDPDAAEQAARAHLRSVITALRETDN
ncbi:GntR family transcriptional regulator [Amycolatopsis sp. CA-161197]|jgi:DNA-binding GntR family transcriptional regulator|uniref:GntR family transcriptional regulator n=1 Tax=unclassified Amycolatopsis TaxID=2618356 RepID=UPI0034566E02